MEWIGIVLIFIMVEYAGFCFGKAKKKKRATEVKSQTVLLHHSQSIRNWWKK